MKILRARARSARDLVVFGAICAVVDVPAAVAAGIAMALGRKKRAKEKGRPGGGER